MLAFFMAIFAVAAAGLRLFRHLLDRVVQEHEIRPGIMPSLISFLAEVNMQSCMRSSARLKPRCSSQGRKRSGERRPIGTGCFTVSWRGLTLIQYWRSFEQLERYARHGANHLSAWRRFNQAVGTGGDVGIFCPHASFLTASDLAGMPDSTLLSALIPETCFSVPVHKSVGKPRVFF